MKRFVLKQVTPNPEFPFAVNDGVLPLYIGDSPIEAIIAHKTYQPAALTQGPRLEIEIWEELEKQDCLCIIYSSLSGFGLNIRVVDRKDTTTNKEVVEELLNTIYHGAEKIDFAFTVYGGSIIHIESVKFLSKEE